MADKWHLLPLGKTKYKIQVNMSKRTYLLILFLWLAAAVSPVFAGQKADTTYTFRFVPQKDMFYVPLGGNDMELVRL